MEPFKETPPRNSNDSFSSTGSAERRDKNSKKEKKEKKEKGKKEKKDKKEGTSFFALRPSRDKRGDSLPPSPNPGVIPPEEKPRQP